MINSLRRRYRLEGGGGQRTTAGQRWRLAKRDVVTDCTRPPRRHGAS